MQKLLIGAAVAATTLSAAPAMAGCTFKYNVLNASGYEIKVTKIETKVLNKKQNGWKSTKKRNINDFTVAPRSGRVAKDQKIARKPKTKVHIFWKYTLQGAGAPSGERTAELPAGPGISCKESHSKRPDVWFN